MIDWENSYTDKHIHPRDNYSVEIVAYERTDRTWDVFVFEAMGSCPELEEKRMDEQHLFISNIESSNQLDTVAMEIEAMLGEGYQMEIYYLEKGSRKIVGRLHYHLKKHGAQNMYVHSVNESDWAIAIRKKDFELAGQVVNTNV